VAEQPAVSGASGQVAQIFGTHNTHVSGLINEYRLVA
jgi:hypothetical protein